MEKTIKVSDHLYEELDQLKEELDHTSFDSTLRDVMQRAGLLEDGQDFEIITEYDRSHYIETVEGDDRVERREYERGYDKYLFKPTAHKTYGPVPNEFEMYGYIPGYEAGKTHGIAYAWPRQALHNGSFPFNDEKTTCSSCGKSLVGHVSVHSAEFSSGGWEVAENSVCMDCELDFPSTDNTAQIKIKTRVRKERNERSPYSHVYTDVEIVDRHYPDENMAPVRV